MGTTFGNQINFGLCHDSLNSLNSVKVPFNVTVVVTELLGVYEPLEIVC